MLRVPTLFIAIMLACGGAFAAAGWLHEYRTAKVQYAIYGGGLGDPVAPTKDDKKIAFHVTGQAARQIFDAIGPDRRDVCLGDAAIRSRHLDGGNVSCLRYEDGQYACHFGYDLKSGKSIPGAVC